MGTSRGGYRFFPIQQDIIPFYVGTMLEGRKFGFLGSPQEPTMSKSNYIAFCGCPSASLQRRHKSNSVWPKFW